MLVLCWGHDLLTQTHIFLLDCWCQASKCSLDGSVLDVMGRTLWEHKDDAKRSKTSPKWNLKKTALWESRCTDPMDFECFSCSVLFPCKQEHHCFREGPATEPSSSGIHCYWYWDRSHTMGVFILYVIWCYLSMPTLGSGPTQGGACANVKLILPSKPLRIHIPSQKVFGLSKPT